MRFGVQLDARIHRLRLRRPMNKFSCKNSLMKTTYEAINSELRFKCTDRHFNKFGKLTDNYFRDSIIYLSRRFNV